MPSGSSSLPDALLRDRGSVTVVYAPDVATRDELVEDVVSFLPPADPVHRVTLGDDVFAQPPGWVLLVPADEEDAVLTMDGRREQLLDRAHPVVLFLLNGGAGERALAEQAPSLSSWLAGNGADPETEDPTDADALRRSFVDATGQTPEAWLAAWRAHALPYTLDNVLRSYDAWLAAEP